MNNKILKTGIKKLRVQSLVRMSLNAALSTLLTSCIDTNVLPNNKIIEEYYWKEKADVQMMVGGAYQLMTSQDVINRLIVWGELRSDEIYVNTTPTGTVPTALQEINMGDIQVTNNYADWAPFYTIINNCNVVLEHARDVMKIDPSYTEGDYLWNRAQMLALRSLCYFYLVRTFRDVPYCGQAFMNSSQELEIPQTAPATVLQHCIDDLVEARQGILSANVLKDWERVGRFTADGVDALLADIYLWRGSLTHNTTDYQACVDACQRVILSKQTQYPKDKFDDTVRDYPLAKGADCFKEVFIDGNSQESILELQFDETKNVNTGLCMNYYKYNNNATHGYLYASSIFSNVGKDYVYTTNHDYRYWMNTYDVGSTTLEDFDIRKMVTLSTTPTNPLNSPQAFRHTSETRAFAGYEQNWILYRLSDVMLMEAEALVQLSTADDDSLLQKAFNLTYEVNLRSMAQTTDAIKAADYASKKEMEKLVLQERQRELCYEGKRWFDLMRYGYRGITPADPTKTLAELQDNGQTMPRTSQDMLQLVARKYKTGDNGVTSKMRSEPSLYFPVYEQEIKVNGLLRQNPYYSK